MGVRRLFRVGLAGVSARRRSLEAITFPFKITQPSVENSNPPNRLCKFAAFPVMDTIGVVLLLQPVLHPFRCRYS